MVHGSWFMVHGSWFMVHGSWFMVHGSWFMVHGSWFMVHGGFHGSWFLDISFKFNWCFFPKAIMSSMVIIIYCFFKIPGQSIGLFNIPASEVIIFDAVSSFHVSVLKTSVHMLI
jgi:hypothetical protein